MVGPLARSTGDRLVVRVARLTAPRRAATMAGMVAATLLIPVPVTAQKTDIVVLLNGDRVTCEVQQVERGLLQVETDGLGTIRIEWDDVASVTSSATFEVELSSGYFHYGQLSAGAPRSLIVGDPGQPPIDMGIVFRIARLELSYWRRLDGSVDIGGSYTQSSGISQTSISTSVGARRRGFEWKTTYDGNVTTTSDDDDGSGRHILSGEYVRLMPNRWILPVFGRFERNEDLGYDLRSSAGAGIGRSFVRSNRTIFLGAGGIGVNRENPVEGDSTVNVEAVGVLSYDLFTYDFPKVDIQSRLATYFSLSDPGRFRLGTHVQVRRDLLSSDVYISFTFYDDYDSRPPAEGSQTNDFGYTFSFGLKF